MLSLYSSSLNTLAFSFRAATIFFNTDVFSFFFIFTTITLITDSFYKNRKLIPMILFRQFQIREHICVIHRLSQRTMYQPSNRLRKPETNLDYEIRDDLDTKPELF